MFRRIGFSVILVSVLHSFNCYAGNIDSLKVLLKKSPENPVLLLEISKAFLSVNSDSALIYAKEALDISKEKNLEKDFAETSFQLGEIYYKKALFDKARESYAKYLKYYNSIKDPKKIAEAFNSIGMTHEAKADYDSALFYYNKSREINTKNKNIEGLANNYNNIGMVYYGWNKYSEGIEYFEKALELDSSLNSYSNIAIDYNNLGLCHFYNKKNETAISYFKKAIDIEISLNKESNLPPYYNNIGLVYYQWQKFDTAMIYFEKALDLSRKHKNDENTALYLCNIAAIYFFSVLDYQSGFKYYKEAEEISIKNRFVKTLYSLYNGYFKVYRNLGDYKTALEYYILRSKYHDTIFNERSLKQIDEFKVKYETEKIEKDRELYKKDNLIKEIENKKQKEINRKQKEVNKKQFILLVVFIAGFLIILILTVIVYRSLKLVKFQKLAIEEKNEELNQQNEEIAAQRDEIENQRKELEIRNENISASIRYASRIQNALLPSQEHINKNIPPHFILYLPRDIVSGDFYWSSLHGNKLIIAAADCTGHGIPGAFMSMLGIAFLNEIVNKDKTLNANQILNELRAKVIESLHQTGKEDDSVDGMDIALAVIDLETGQLQFSGANNPLWIVRNKEIIELPADKVPIGYYKIKIESYTNQEFKLQNGDVLYIFSDGFADQFGGSLMRKFMKSNFKDLLLKIHHLEPEKQEQILVEQLNKWQGSNNQTDDILVIGMKF